MELKKHSEEITQEWMDILSDLWIAFGKQVDPKRLKVYIRNLSFIPLGLLEKAVPIAIQKQRKFNIVPTVGSVIEALEQTLGHPPDLNQAVDEWADRGFEKLFIPIPG